MYCNHKTSDSDDFTVRSIVVVMKIRVSVSSLSKVQLRHPWQESIFVQKRIHVVCTPCSMFGFHTEGPQEIHILCYYCFTLDFTSSLARKHFRAKTHTRCLHTLFYVRISHRGPSRNSHFVLLLLYIGFCHSRGTVVAGLDNVLFSFIRSDGFTLQVYIKHYIKLIVSSCKEYHIYYKINGSRRLRKLDVTVSVIFAKFLSSAKSLSSHM